MRSLLNYSAINVAQSELDETAYMSLVALQRNMTLEKAVTSATVRQVALEFGEGLVVKTVVAILKLFNDGLNTTEQMGWRQLFEYAGLWVEQFPHDTLKDLLLCLKNVKMGKYGKDGKIYNRIDGAVISDFFRQYLEEKAEWAEKQHYRIKGEFNRVPDDAVPMPDNFREDFERMLLGAKLKQTPVLTNEREYLSQLKEVADSLTFEQLADMIKQFKKQGKQEGAAILRTELEKRATEQAKSFTLSIEPLD